MKRLLLIFIPLVLFASASAPLAPSARADRLDDVLAQLESSGGRYVRAGASMTAADCSGLVSVAQSLAMGVPIHRFGSTGTILAGNWPYAIPGASPGDRFVIGANSAHMVAEIDGVAVEASTSGQPFRFGPAAQSPWSPQFRRFHLDPAVLQLA